jgi:hypothetical protein
MLIKHFNIRGFCNGNVHLWFDERADAGDLAG